MARKLLLLLKNVNRVLLDQYRSALIDHAAKSLKSYIKNINDKQLLSLPEMMSLLNLWRQCGQSGSKLAELQLNMLVELQLNIAVKFLDSSLITHRIEGLAEIMRFRKQEMHMT